jgi:ribonuclease HII
MPVKFDRSLLPPAPDLSFECALWSANLLRVAGIDEAGRGALAGPVAAAVVILPADPGQVLCLRGVRDSKQMNAAERTYWAGKLPEIFISWAVGFASAAEIDTLGIVPATRLAVLRALHQLPEPPVHLLIDYLKIPDSPLPQTALVKGDQRSLSIAAASIMAKTTRDALMCQLDGQYTGYGFAVHKGYGTFAHRQAIGRLGLSPIHRCSFKHT